MLSCLHLVKRNFNLAQGSISEDNNIITAMLAWVACPGLYVYTSMSESKTLDFIIPTNSLLHMITSRLLPFPTIPIDIESADLLVHPLRRHPIRRLLLHRKPIRHSRLAHLLQTLGRSITPNEKLRSQPEIAAHLEDAAKLEGDGDAALAAPGSKEKPHLEHVANDPVHDDGEAEALASTPLVVCQQLREGQRGFDGQRYVTQEIGVGNEETGGGHREVEDEQGESEVCQERPVRACGGPLPEIVRSR